jgi:hypothetical protein
VGALFSATQELANQIVALGNRLGSARTSGEKNEIAAQLAMIVKHDLGGVTFMSDEVNDVVDNGGLLPGTAAVLSSAVTSSYAAHHQIPTLLETDLEMYINTIVESYRLLHDRMPEARDQLQKRAISADRINHIENIALKNSKQN